MTYNDLDGGVNVRSDFTSAMMRSNPNDSRVMVYNLGMDVTKIEPVTTRKSRITGQISSVSKINNEHLQRQCERRTAVLHVNMSVDDFKKITDYQTILIDRALATQGNDLALYHCPILKMVTLVLEDEITKEQCENYTKGNRDKKILPGGSNTLKWEIAGLRDKDNSPLSSKLPSSPESVSDERKDEARFRRFIMMNSYMPPPALHKGQRIYLDRIDLSNATGEVFQGVDPRPAASIIGTKAHAQRCWQATQQYGSGNGSAEQAPS